MHWALSTTKIKFQKLVTALSSSSTEEEVEIDPLYIAKLSY